MRSTTKAVKMGTTRELEEMKRDIRGKGIEGCECAYWEAQGFGKCANCRVRRTYQLVSRF